MNEVSKLLYIGVCKDNLEKYYPSYISGIFLEGTFTDTELVEVVKRERITILMVDVFHLTFTKSLLRQLKGHIQLINFSYQSIDSLIDLNAAKNCDIAVRKLPDDIYCNEVAEFAVTQLLCACKGIIQFDQSVKNGEWNQAVNTNVSLQGKTLGVVGFGNIGKRIVELCENWGMNILITRKNIHNSPFIANTTFVEFSRLVEESNFIILALPITKDTFQLLDEKHIQNLKESSILINISRGDIVDESAVFKSLQSGRIHRYCTDVFSHEPINKGHVLLKSDKTILSPHIAWATEDTLKKTYKIWFSHTNI